MILGMIVIGLSTFTVATKNLLDLLANETRSDINGEWTAEVTYPGKQVSYIETFSFDGDGVDVDGTASFLEKMQVVVEGKVIEDRLQFKTKTLEYSPDWNNSNRKVVTHHYRGKVLGDEIKFVMETYGGFSANSPIKFTAKKIDN